MSLKLRAPRRLTAVLAMAIFFSASALPCCETTGALMRQLGYAEVQPPSNLMQPGAIVAISHKRPFAAALVCGPRASLGASWTPQQSPTTSTTMSRLNGKSFKLQADLMDNIRADARFKAINSMVMTMNRARIVEVRDEDIVGNVRNRSRDCQSAIHARLTRGFRLTLISSSLSGDVTYSVRFNADASLEGRAKLDMLDQLALELGGNTTSVSESEVHAVDLVWGVKDDAYLASIGLPDDLMPTPEDRGEPIGLIPNNRAARILPIPDAEVVMPANRRISLDGYDQALDALVRNYRQPTRPLPDGAPIFDPRHAPSRRFEEYVPMQRRPSGLIPFDTMSSQHSGSQYSAY